jgi:hypothetical protein
MQPVRHASLISICLVDNRWRMGAELSAIHPLDSSQPAHSARERHCLPDEVSTVLAVSRASKRPKTAALDAAALDARVSRQTALAVSAEQAGGIVYGHRSNRDGKTRGISHASQSSNDCERAWISRYGYHSGGNRERHASPNKGFLQRRRQHLPRQRISESAGASMEQSRSTRCRAARENAASVDTAVWIIPKRRLDRVLAAPSLLMRRVAAFVTLRPRISRA